MIKTKLLTSMAKVFPDSDIDLLYTPKEFTCLIGEKLCFQIAIKSTDDKSVSFEINDKGDLNVYEVGCVPAVLVATQDSDDYYLKKTPGLYPDMLKEKADSEIKLKKDEVKTLFFEYSSKSAGDKKIKISFDFGEEITVDIFTVNAYLPKQDVICTHWFHTDCLCDWYEFEPFSDDYWLCIENYTKTAVEHGINSLLIPLFTPALDTEIGKERRTVQLVDVNVNNGKYSFSFDKLRKWLSVFIKCGIEYFEFSHFFTQWGALHAPKIMATVDGEYKRIFGWETDSTGEEYVSFLIAFSKALKPVLKEFDIENKSLFHISDEPSEDNIDQYKKCNDIVNSVFGEYKIIDALSSFEFYKRGIVKTPVVCVDHAIDFESKADDFWIYYCCAPTSGYFPNRFLSMPSQRTRILGMQMYKFNASGFLHWGYNFWRTQLSKQSINPYEVTDAGGAFTAGDAFVVYPGENFKPVCSLRLKTFFDGWQDLRALKLLETFIGKNEVLNLIEDKCELTFSSYPRSEIWQFEKRNEINKAIDKSLTK